MMFEFVEVMDMTRDVEQRQLCLSLMQFLPMPHSAYDGPRNRGGTAKRRKCTTARLLSAVACVSRWQVSW